jgi:hypothetical protein
MLIILVILILLFGGFGVSQWGTPYGHGGIGLGTVLLIVLIFMLFSGRL